MFNIASSFLTSVYFVFVGIEVSLHFRSRVREKSSPSEKRRFFARRDGKNRRFVPLKRSVLGAHSEREIPVPIPNTAVKPLSGYNTWVF